jgi:hypothetical protein
MIKYSLLGKHSHRTPLAYDVYQEQLAGYFEYVSNPYTADFIVLGFMIDIFENREVVKKIKTCNPSAKFVVISEEPLWDSVWSGDFINNKRTILLEDFELEVFYFNHFNSNIFEYSYIPYYITTNNLFVTRYRLLFERNLNYTHTFLRDFFKEKDGEAYFLEFRNDPRYDIKNQHANGLSVYRSNLAKYRATRNKNTIVRGKGWGSKKPRQSLVDWHLDKLTTIDKNFRYCSAIENTDAPNYISEKYFDALATLSIPLVCTSFNSNRLANSVIKPYVNCVKDNLNETSAIIDDFELDRNFIDSFRDNINYWYNFFINPEFFQIERKFRIKKIHSILEDL